MHRAISSPPPVQSRADCLLLSAFRQSTPDDWDHFLRWTIVCFQNFPYKLQLDLTRQIEVRERYLEHLNRFILEIEIFLSWFLNIIKGFKSRSLKSVAFIERSHIWMELRLDKSSWIPINISLALLYTIQIFVTIRLKIL